MVIDGCIHKFMATALLLGLLTLFSGCAAPTVIQSQAADQSRLTGPPVTVPVQAVAAVENHSAGNGSLWVDGGSLSEMFINAKARRVGDIVTIKIVENSKATNNATTKTDRTTAMSVGLTDLFGLENKFPSGSNFFNPFSPLESDYSNQFDGSGSTARSGALTAYITARIIQIQTNGNLVIEGNREVRVNGENQIITLTGLIRPRDISPANIVQSTYIADARISYSGSGVLNDQQRPGWLARILNNIWPF
jgi:flagellar L-ring protein precursor FlgH